MKTIYLLIIFLFLSSFCFGMAVGPLEIHGVVVKYDKKTVTLKNDNGKTIKVSKQAIPKGFKLRSGARVQALLKPEDILKQPKKKAKR